MTQEIESFTSAMGAGIAPAPLALVPDLVEDVIDVVVEEMPEAYVGKHRAPIQGVVTTIVKDEPIVPAFEGTPAEPITVDLDTETGRLREEFRIAVDDVEWRLAQVYEQRLRDAIPGHMGMVTVEDINDGTHRLTGYTLTQNTPAGGGTWASLHVVFKGVDYTVANGSSTSQYIYFVKANATAVTGTTASIALSTSATFPTLGAEDALIFVNNGGVFRSILEESVASVVAPGSVTQASLASDVQTVLTSLRSDLTNAQATADGAIVSYFQPAPPWATGSTQPDSKVGDVWYDSDDGGAFRWSGSAGSPANTWVRIADTDTAALAGKVGTKTTTYITTNASPPVAPAAAGGVPAGFTVGDLWMVTDQGNKFKRWSGATWDDLLIGDSAIASVGAGKVSGVLTAGNIPTLDGATKITGTLNTAQIPVLDFATKTSGTIQAARVGVLGNGNIGSGAVQPQNINTAYHILY